MGVNRDDFDFTFSMRQVYYSMSSTLLSVRGEFYYSIRYTFSTRHYHFTTLTSFPPSRVRSGGTRIYH